MTARSDRTVREAAAIRGRRDFLKTLGVSAICTLVLTELPLAEIEGGQGGGQPCAYGAGRYGAGLYSGLLAASSPVIRADKSSNDLLLTWSGAPAETTYEVWRSHQPFVPGDPDSNLIATVAGTSYVDPAALSTPGNRYYAVRAILACE